MRTPVLLRAALVTATALAGLTGATALPAYAAQSYTWVGGGATTSWSDAANWSPVGIPGQTAGDSASISSNTGCVGATSVTDVPPVQLASFSVSDPLHGCGVNVTGGPITTGSFSWNGGTLNSSLTVQGSGTISGSNGHMNVLDGDLTDRGTLTLAGVVEPAGTDQGGLMLINPHSIHVLASGTLVSDGPNAIHAQACCVTPATIVNDGTLRVGDGSLTVHGVAVEQHGTIETAAGANLIDDGAPATAADGATYTGVGRWVVEDGGELTLSGTQHLGDGFRLTLGDGETGATLDGTATLSGAGKVDWAGGTIKGHLTIAHGTALTASGTTVNNGRRFLSGSVSPGSATLTNHGRMAFSGGATVGTATLPELVNASDGVLSLAPGTTFSAQGCCAATDKVINQGGTVTVPTGSSSASVDLDGVSYLTTGGTTSIAAKRTLQLLHAPSKLAATTVSGGGTLAVAAPTAVSGTTTIGSSTTLALRTGGSLDGTAVVTGTGRTTWTGGSVSGKITLATSGGVAASGTDIKTVANVGGGETPSTLTVKAPLSLAAGTAAHHDTLEVGRSTLLLTGTTKLGNNSALIDGIVRNSGRLTVAAGTGGTVQSGGGSIINSNQVTVSSGTWQVNDYRQTAGHTTIAGSAHLNRLYTSYTIAIAGGTLDGSGTVGAGLDNTGGTIRPGGSSVGTLHIAGDYHQGNGGALSLDLGASAHDLLAVAGSARIAGTIHATDLGTYRPPVGRKTTVAKGGSLSTGSLCVTTSGSGHTSGHWAATHTATALGLVWRTGAARAC